MKTDILGSSMHTTILWASVLMSVALLVLGTYPFATSTSQIDLVKQGIFVVVSLVLLFLAGSYSFLHGIRIPRSSVVVSGVFVILTTFASAFLSENVRQSIIGFVFDMDTAVTVSLLVGLMLVASIAFQRKITVLYFLFSLFFVAFLVSLFTIFDAVFFEFFFQSGASIVGSWADLVSFFALFALMSAVTFDAFVMNPIVRVLVGILFIISVFIMTTAHLPTILYAVAGASLLFVIGTIRNMNIGQGMVKTPWVSASLLMIVIFLMVVQAPFSSFAPNADSEPQLSLKIAYTAAARSLSEKPKNLILGSGPNTFSQTWHTYKPRSFNETLFWDHEFVSGPGFIPTLATTSGLLGIIGWGILILGVLYEIIRHMWTRNDVGILRYLVGVLGALTFFCFWLMLFYTPTIVIAAIGFVGLGILLSITHAENAIAINVRKRFLKKLGVAGLGVLFAGALYGASLVIISSLYYEKGLREFTSEANIENIDFEKVNDLLRKALDLSEEPIYYRTLSQIEQQHIKVILEAESGGTSESYLNLQSTGKIAVSNAINAVGVEPNAYLNWVVSGNVYTQLALIGTEGAAEKAILSYTEASVQAPTNPQPVFLLARLREFLSDESGALNDLDTVLFLKSDFAPAQQLMRAILYKN